MNTQGQLAALWLHISNQEFVSTCLWDKDIYFDQNKLHSMVARVFLFSTHSLYLLGQSTLTVAATYKATAKILEFFSGKSNIATPF